MGDLGFIVDDLSTPSSLFLGEDSQLVAMIDSLLLVLDFDSAGSKSMAIYDPFREVFMTGAWEDSANDHLNILLMPITTLTPDA